MEQAKQQEGNIILTIAKNKDFPLQFIHNLKNKLIIKTQQSEATSTLIQQKKIYATFIYNSRLVHKVNNLFNYTKLNITFRASNTSYNHLSNKTAQNKMNASGL